MACKIVSMPQCGNASMRCRSHFRTNFAHIGKITGKRAGSLAENQGTLSFTIQPRLISIQARHISARPCIQGVLK